MMTKPKRSVALVPIPTVTATPIISPGIVFIFLISLPFGAARVRAEQPLPKNLLPDFKITELADERDHTTGTGLRYVRYQTKHGVLYVPAFGKKMRLDYANARCDNRSQGSHHTGLPAGQQLTAPSGASLAEIERSLKAQGKYSATRAQNLAAGLTETDKQRRGDTKINQDFDGTAGVEIFRAEAVIVKDKWKAFVGWANNTALDICGTTSSPVAFDGDLKLGVEKTNEDGSKIKVFNRNLQPNVNLGVSF